MNDQTANPSSTNASRCRHFTLHGRQCRLRVLDTHSGFCFRHAQPRPVQSDSDDLTAELLGEISEYAFASEINMFLSKLLILVTKGRVSPRRASVLAYITNQLLHCHRAIDYDRQFHSEDSGVEICAEILRGAPRPIHEDAPKVS
jgi:hypothetical protein